MARFIQIEGLVEKHRAALEQAPSKVDSRIAALLKEKEQDYTPGLQMVIDFFAEVFVKYLYMKTNFGLLRADQIIDILRQNYGLDNTQFAAQIKTHINQLVFTQQQQQRAAAVVPAVVPAGPAATLPLPDSARQSMVRAALHPPPPQHRQLPPPR